MSKINMYGFNKNASELVCSYVYNHATRKGISGTYSLKIEDANRTLEVLKRCTVVDETAVKAQTAVIETLERQRKEECAKWTYTATVADKNLKKRLKASHQPANVWKAVQKWYLENFGVKMDDNALINEIINSAGCKADWALFVDTDGTQVTTLNASNLVRMCYLLTYEKMVGVGFISEAKGNVPEILHEFYSAKKAIALAKKAEAKNAKKA